MATTSWRCSWSRWWCRPTTASSTRRSTCSSRPTASSTVRKTPAPAPGCHRHRPAVRPLRRPRVARRRRSTCGPGTIAYRIADDVAEAFLDLLDDIHEEIDQLEDQVEDANDEHVRTRISELRHDLLHIRRTLAPTRDAVRRIVDGRVDGPNDSTFPHELELQFGDVFDKLLRASEGLESARDLIGGVRDYHQAKVANDQNEVMKRLTDGRLAAAAPNVHRGRLRAELHPHARAARGCTATCTRGSSSWPPPRRSCGGSGATTGSDTRGGAPRPAEPRTRPVG